METATGDSAYNLKTRSKKANIDPINEIQLLKQVSNESPEVQALIHDQIYHNFVEKVIDPDHGPLAEELANEDEFVPNDDSVIEVEDGGSSEEELDEEEEANPVNEDEISEVSMEATVNKEIMLKNIPPAMAAAYKKRFPNFWHIHEGIRVHSGKGYDAEEDPDFELKEDPEMEDQERDETIELSSDSSSDDEVDEENMGDEMAALASKVEDLMIPDETMDEIAASKTLDTVDEADIEEDDSESDDETDTNEPDHLDLIDDKKDMIYDDDVAYEPIEEGNKSDSEDSYASAEGEDESDDEADDESEQENMDE